MASLERGLFLTADYYVYRSERKIASDENFTIPLYREEEEKKYHALDEDGAPRVGSYVKKGDCIIGKVRMDRNTNNAIDVSTYVKPGEKGEVDSVNISDNDGMTVVIVRIKQIRSPGMGDHFASHYAQIPITCGFRIPEEEDIPWTSDKN